MPQPVSYNPGIPVSGSIQENNISYVVDGQQRNYRGGFGGLSWMSEVPAENNVIFIGNSTSLGRGPAGKPLFYPSYNNSSANIVYAANTLPGSPRNFTTTGSAYNWAVTNNFLINNSNNPIPRIDADGLVLYLSAFLPTSYPQTGTTWYDLSGYGNNATLYNGLNSNWNSNGWFSFDGVDDYANITYNSTSMAAWTGSQTIIFWEYHTFNDASRRNLWNQAYGGAGTWTHEGGYDINYFYGNSGTDNIPYTSINSSTTPTGRWNMLTTTRDPNQVKWYRNNINTNTASNLYGVLTLTTSDISVGTGYTGQYWVGNIGAIAAYNKALTQSEINQVYFQSNIVQDGLVFMIDANNLVSYPKSGTSTYSLTGSDVGTLLNGVGYSNSNGGTFSFDGVDDYILGTDTYNLSNFTAEVWVYPTATPPSNSFPSAISTTFPGTNSTVNYAIGWYNGGAYWFGGFFNGSSGGWHEIFVTPPTLNTWHHYSLTYNGSVMIFYHNGVVEGTFNTTDTAGGGGPIRIGRRWDIGNYFPGNIANSKVYSRALTSDEVQQNYQATKDKFQGPQIITNGLIVNLDAANKDSYPGTGTTWTDLSGNANNGTLINGPSFNIDSGGCIDFDGIDDSVTGNKPVLSAVTLEYYCKLTGNSTGGFPHLVMSGNTFIGFVGNTSSARFRIAINPGAGYSEITSDLLNPSATFKLYSMTYDGTTVKMFVNGVQQASTMNIASTFELMTGNAYQLSAVTTPSYDKAPNKMAAFRIYNRALSATEIAQNYNATKTRFGL